MLASHEPGDLPAKRSLWHTVRVPAHGVADSSANFVGANDRAKSRDTGTNRAAAHGRLPPCTSDTW